MARYLCGAKLLAAADYAFSVSSRNLSSAAAAPSLARGTRPAVVVARPEEKYSNKDVTRDAPAAWVPDPETGYYRPSNRGKEVDGAELRRILLKKRRD